MTVTSAPVPTVEDLALCLLIPVEAESCCDEMAGTLQAVSGMPLTPDQLAALAAARSRLADLQAAAGPLEHAAAALACTLWPGASEPI